MNPLQLTYPTQECVRCHRHTHEHRLCAQCRADDEVMTRASAQALKMACSAFSVRLGYHDSLDRVEATCDWYDHHRGLEWPTVREQQEYWTRKEAQ